MVGVVESMGEAEEEEEAIDEAEAEAERRRFSRRCAWSASRRASKIWSVSIHSLTLSTRSARRCSCTVFSFSRASRPAWSSGRASVWGICGALGRGERGGCGVVLLLLRELVRLAGRERE